MSNPDLPSLPNESALANAALTHVRAIFKGNGIKSDKITILSQKIAQHTMNAGTYLELKPVMAERSAPGRLSPETSSIRGTRPCAPSIIP